MFVHLELLKGLHGSISQTLSTCEVFQPPYLCDFLCDVLRAVLHRGGAEQPWSWRRAAFRAPAAWTPTPHKV